MYRLHAAASCVSLFLCRRQCNTITLVHTVSLDVEGAELAVLNSIDWSRVTIGLLVIEHNGQEQQIDDFLTARGYRQVKDVDGDPSDGKWRSSDVMYILNSEFPAHAH